MLNVSLRSFRIQSHCLDFKLKQVHLKVTQINNVSRNQLHFTANGCEHLNFGLMCKGKTLPGVVNKLFIFSSADPKQNILLNWRKNSTTVKSFGSFYDKDNLLISLTFFTIAFMIAVKVR